MIAKYDPHFRSVGADEAGFELSRSHPLFEDPPPSADRSRASELGYGTEGSESEDEDAEMEGVVSGPNLRSVLEGVNRIRKEVFEATGLTCSGGIGVTPMVAKISSDFRKPVGIPHTSTHPL